MKLHLQNIAFWFVFSAAVLFGALHIFGFFAVIEITYSNSPLVSSVKISNTHRCCYIITDLDEPQQPLLGWHISVTPQRYPVRAAWLWICDASSGRIWRGTESGFHRGTHMLIVVHFVIYLPCALMAIGLRQWRKSESGRCHILCLDQDARCTKDCAEECTAASQSCRVDEMSTEW